LPSGVPLDELSDPTPRSKDEGKAMIQEGDVA
jgi:hypothetical protein